MKTKDIVFLLLAVIILLVAGYVGYTQLMPKSTADVGVQVDKIGKIPSQMDSAGLARLSDTSKARDFSSPIEYSGVGNKAPFGQ